jgi:cytochrome c biogenesis protein CcdA
MKKLSFLLIGLLAITLVITLMAGVSAQEQTNVYYFYGETCSHCAVVADSNILEQVEEMENVSLAKYEIYNDQENRDLFSEVSENVGLEKSQMGIPFIVIEQDGKYSYLSGDSPIINNLEDEIINFKGIEPKNTPTTDSLTLTMILSAALIDSINPCAFGVLLFLMAVLLSMGSSKKALKAGLTYSFVVFLAYLAAGIGILRLIGFFSIVGYITAIAGILVLIGGIIEIKDFFWYGKGISLRIPTKAKPMLEKLIHNGTLPAIIILGIIVAIVELPCTGGIYLAILGIMSETPAFGLGYLILYNFIFVLPLIILTLLIYKGTHVDNIKSWVDKHKKYMRLAAGIIMIILAIYLLV